MVWECRYRNVKRAVWSMSQGPAIATRLEGYVRWTEALQRRSWAVIRLFPSFRVMVSRIWEADAILYVGNNLRS